MEPLYCVNCKTKTQWDDITWEKTKNGRDAVRGLCTVCGNKTFQFKKKPE